MPTSTQIFKDPAFWIYVTCNNIHGFTLNKIYQKQKQVFCAEPSVVMGLSSPSPQSFGQVLLLLLWGAKQILIDLLKDPRFQITNEERFYLVLHNDWFYLGNSFTHTPTLDRCFNTSFLMSVVKLAERKLEIEIPI